MNGTTLRNDNVVQLTVGILALGIRGGGISRQQSVRHGKLSDTFKNIFVTIDEENIYTQHQCTETKYSTQPHSIHSLV